MALRPPCYNRETGEDCKDRCTGCSTICALWHQYTQERNKYYEERKKQSQAEGDMIAYQVERHRKLKKYRPRSKQGRNNKW